MTRFTTKYVRSLIAKHEGLWLDKKFVIPTIISFFFFASSFFVNYVAIVYSGQKEGNATTDLLLDNLPVMNTDIIFSQGVVVFAIFGLILLALEPKIIPFTLRSVALFYYVRSTFIIMTHLSPPLDRIATDLDKYTSSAGADLFFSGHTGLPFLLALIFWQNRKLRWFFLVCSVTAAAAVLLGHLHYTIDVFAAFFITYGIYHIALRAFPKSHKLFVHGLQNEGELLDELQKLSWKR